MISPALIGGVLLVIGAYLMYTGNVKYSILTYFVADIMWAIMAYIAEDYIGLTFVLIGMVLGFGVFLKIHTGIFRKDLHVDKAT